MYRISVIVCMGLFLLLSCGGERVKEVDLKPLLPHGEFFGETWSLPLDATQSEAFGTGFSWPEKDRHGNSYRWATGPESHIDFFCAVPRELNLRISLRPFRYPGAPEQSLQIVLNGSPVGKAEFSKRCRLEFTLPSRLLRAGMNHLDFRWGYSMRVSDVSDSRDNRRLAAALASITLEGLRDSGGLRRFGKELEVSPSGMTLLPPASEIRITLNSGPDAWLELDGEGLDGLELRVRQEHEEFRRIETAGGPVTRLRNSSGLLQLALRTGVNAKPALGKVVLRWKHPFDASASELKWKQQQRSARVRHPDIILYVIDTLRADRLGCFGGPEGLTPSIDRFASDAVVFEQAIAQSSWTRPSMISLLSGLLTTEHGLRSRKGKIPGRVQLVSEYLQEAGYRTGALTTNAYLIPAAGFNQGFDHFSFEQLSSHELTNRAIRWLGEQPRDKPVFLWLHSVDPHAPYQPAEPYRSRWAPGVPREYGTVEHIQGIAVKPAEERGEFIHPYRALYDAEIAENDAAFGELLDSLHKSGRYDQSCIVFVSDHGEEFWEHGVNGHGWDLFEEVLHVPLLIKVPAGVGGGRRVSTPVQHIDLLPTLLHLAGIPLRGKLRGMDLLAESPPPERLIFSEMSYGQREGFAIRSGHLKLIEGLSPGFLPSTWLSDLKADPAESRNVIEDHQLFASWLAQEGRLRMGLLPAAAPAVEAFELGQEAREGLEALGYLKASPDQ